jgi:phosphotransferase system HPr-like phosphotransfer protein
VLFRRQAPPGLHYRPGMRLARTADYTTCFLPVKRGNRSRDATNSEIGDMLLIFQLVVAAGKQNYIHSAVCRAPFHR